MRDRELTSDELAELAAEVEVLWGQRGLDAIEGLTATGEIRAALLPLMDGCGAEAWCEALVRQIGMEW